MLLGRNGAGKTTTLRTIMGLWQASTGEISFDGQRIEKRATPDIARLGIAYVPESMGYFRDLSVRENMVLAARDGAARRRPGWSGFSGCSRRCGDSGCRGQVSCPADRSRCCRSRAPSSSRASCF